MLIKGNKKVSMILLVLAIISSFIILGNISNIFARSNKNQDLNLIDSIEIKDLDNDSNSKKLVVTFSEKDKVKVTDQKEVNIDITSENMFYRIDEKVTPLVTKEGTKIGEAKVNNRGLKINFNDNAKKVEDLNGELTLPIEILRVIDQDNCAKLKANVVDTELEAENIIDTSEFQKIVRNKRNKYNNKVQKPKSDGLFYQFNELKEGEETVTVCIQKISKSKYTKDRVEFTLYQNDKEYLGSIKPVLENNNIYVWKGLPAKDANGNQYVYTVK